MKLVRIAVATLALALQLASLVHPAGAAKPRHPATGAGDLDPSFGTGGIVTTTVSSSNDAAGGVVIQSDGKVVVAGYGAQLLSDFVVIRYTADGSLDPSFGGTGIVATSLSSSQDNATDVAVQEDGKLVVVGSTLVSTTNDIAVVRYNPDGALDTTFGGDGIVTTGLGRSSSEIGNAVQVQADGKILVAGWTAASNDSDFVVVRYNPTGTLDTSFSGDGIARASVSQADTGTDVAIDPNGKVVVVGTITDPVSGIDFAAVRYNSDGTLDTTFSGDGVVTTPIGSAGKSDWAYAVQAQPDGKVLVAGQSYAATGDADFTLVRYESNGSLDTSFGGDGIVLANIGNPASEDHAYDVLLQSDDRIIAVGDATGASGVPDFAAARFDPGGSLDPSFSGDGMVIVPIGLNSDSALGAALQPNGRVVLAGQTFNFSNGYDFASARLFTEVLSESTLTLSAEPDPIAVGDQATLSGNLSFEDGGSAVGMTIHLTRTNPDASTTSLPDATTVALGAFSAFDTPPTAGAYVYTAAYDGDETHGPATVTDDLSVTGQAEADFNGDQYADLAVGVPGESVGTLAGAGAVNVLYGSATGLTSTGNQLWTQDSTDVADASEAGDTFGFAVAAGDFNGDGFADLAIGSPYEDIGTTADAGVVNVLYGSAGGLTAVGNQLWNQNGIILDFYETGDVFGWSVASADVNGDGFADLAIGVPGEDGIDPDVGRVNVILGSSTGLVADHNELWGQGAIGDLEEAGDVFGFSLVLGDFNGDGFADLVSGAPGEDVGSIMVAGAVDAVYGSAAGLTSTGAQFWTQDTTDIKDLAEAGDQFGFAVAAGDMDGDGFTDVSIGVPFENNGTVSDGGGVNVIYGSALGLATTDNQWWNQNSANILDSAEKADEFGFSVAVGDFDVDGFADLAVGVPGENLVPADAGAANVIYGTGGGLASTGNQLWDQDSTSIKDLAETGDQFGYTVSAGDFGNGPQDDLVLGVPMENNGSITEGGAVNVIYGSASNLNSTGNQYWNQNSANILDSAEAFDEFGFGLSFGPGSGPARLPDHAVAPMPSSPTET